MDTFESPTNLKIKICKRLKEARIKAGFKSAKDFAEKKKLKVSTYSLHEAGTRSMSLDIIEQYANILDINTNWLLAGIEPCSRHKVRHVPIIEWDEVEKFIRKPCFVEKLTTPSDIDLSPLSFALVVNNDAMEPIYPEGALIMVDNVQEPKHKDFALLQIKAKAIPIFKQLMHVDGEIFAKSLNSDYPAIKLSPKSKILGKVVQAKLIC